MCCLWMMRGSPCLALPWYVLATPKMVLEERGSVCQRFANHADLIALGHVGCRGAASVIVTS